MGNQIETFDTLRTVIKIEGKAFNVKFDVVTTNFLVPESDITGQNFIKETRIVLDFSRDTFMMPQYKTIRFLDLTRC